MNVKTSRKKSVDKQSTVNYCLWVRETMCIKKPKQKSEIAKGHPPALQAAMERHWIATNHL